MKNFSRKGKYLIFIFFFLFLLASSIQSQEVKIKKENGVTVVYNPKKPAPLPGTPTKLVLTEDLLIGVESGNEDYMFSRLSSIQVDDEEDIIVLDGKEVCIKVFDKKGTFIRKFGRKGQGPGEIQRPWGMYLAGGKKITINDTGNNRFSYFTKKGESIQEIARGKYRPYLTMADSRGYIYGHMLVFKEKIPTSNLVKFDQEFEPIITITSLEMPKEPPPAELMELYHFQVLEDDSFIWGRTYKYELNIINKDGNLVKKILRDYKPVNLTKENLKQELKLRYPELKLPKKIRNIPSHFPKHYPIFYKFICDDEGQIYVKTFERDKKNNIIYDVFDSEGRFFSQFSLPNEESIAVITNKMLYCAIGADKEGIPRIKRYKMDWK